MKASDKKSFEYENLICLIFGAWVFMSPLIGGTIANYQGAHVYMWNFFIIGLSVIFMSIFALKNMVAWAERVNIIFGVWLMVSPLFLIYFNLSNFYFWNAIISGLVIGIASALALPAADHVIFHRHIKTKAEEKNSIPVYKARDLHHHSP